MAMISCADVALLALDLSKATFDNAYESLATLQQKVEEGARALVRRAPWAPPELGAVLDEWVGLSRRSREDLRATVDRSYVLLRALAGTPADETEAAPKRRSSSRHLQAA